MLCGTTVVQPTSSDYKLCRTGLLESSYEATRGLMWGNCTRHLDGVNCKSEEHAILRTGGQHDHTTMRHDVVLLLALGVLTCLQTGSGLTCYTCKESFRWVYYSTVCENEVTRDNSSLSSCGSSARYCMIESTSVNGIITNFERGCADTCYYGCKMSGLGVTKEANLHVLLRQRRLQPRQWGFSWPVLPPTGANIGLIMCNIPTDTAEILKIM
ncbi:hypothetical protein Bbelb_016450 [Branchiostoma belcheri]|nr:hypothetical protein Bbelb_016450 [Branchiostoma belcheri]